MPFTPYIVPQLFEEQVWDPNFPPFLNWWSTVEDFSKGWSPCPPGEYACFVNEDSTNLDGLGSPQDVDMDFGFLDDDRSGPAHLSPRNDFFPSTWRPASPSAGRWSPATSSSGSDEEFMEDDSSPNGGSQADRQPAYCCTQCQKSFTTSQQLETHAKLVNHRTYICGEPGCTQNFKRRDTFVRHMKTTHETTYRHSCAECKKLFKRKDHLHQHERNCHPEISFCSPSGEWRVRVVAF